MVYSRELYSDGWFGFGFALCSTIENMLEYLPQNNYSLHPHAAFAHAIAIKSTYTAQS